MKLLNSQELKSLISRGHISLCGDSLILDDTYIERDAFVASMYEICHKDTKNKSKNEVKDIEPDNFSDYGKQTQKSKSKRRKSK